jgi:hypothetical protein
MTDELGTADHGDGPIVRTFTQASLVYAGCLAACGLAVWSWLVPGLLPGAVVGLVYVVCGVALNRIVLRGLIVWHPVYDTLGNVSRAKIRMLLWWPFAYPALFLRLLVVRYL